MDFPSYLVRRHCLTKTEYAKISWRSIKSKGSATNKQTDFLEPSLEQVSPENLGSIRPYPFGDVLANSEFLSKVLRRARVSSFEALIDSWHQWHVDHIQPISDFCLSPLGDRSFGQKLWNCELEKRLCAVWVAEHIVQNWDHVIIPEGTSTFWVALAALALRSDLLLITSNGGVVRELHENPELRKRANSVTVIGGEIDVEVGGNGRGFVGDATQEGYDAAITRKPGATVVVSSVNGLLPEDGPYAPCPVSGMTRYSLLRKALESNVRRLVLVADHSKMRPSMQKDYGDAIFSDKREWRAILKNHLDRLVIVVAPPESVRYNPAIMSIRPKSRVIRGNEYPPSVVEYLTVAARFDDLCSTNDGQSRFIEVGMLAETRDMVTV